MKDPYEEDWEDKVDWCIFCLEPPEKCKCATDPALESLQGEEEHDKIDSEPYGE